MRTVKFAPRNRKHPSLVYCEVYFDILNRLGVTHQCDRQIDRQTDRPYDSKGGA